MKAVRTVDVVDDYHGTKVPDPYRWLEDASSPETVAFVEAQNAVTFDFLAAIPERDKIQVRLTTLWNYPRYSVPHKEGERYFFSKNSGLQNQAVLYMQKTLGGEAVVIFDPNTLSEDGTVALTTTSYSKDGTLLAYSTSQSGSDWQEIKIRRTDSGPDYPDVIRWCKFTSIAWKDDKSCCSQ